MPGNDMRVPSIAKELAEAIQRGITPKFKLDKELLGRVGYFSVNEDGTIRQQSPEQAARDHTMLEANRFRPIMKEEVEVN